MPEVPSDDDTALASAELHYPVVLAELRAIVTSAVFGLVVIDLNAETSSVTAATRWSTAR